MKIEKIKKFNSLHQWIKIFLISSLASSLLKIISNNFKNVQDLPFNWPSNVMIPVVKAIRGELEYDFFSQSVIKTQIVNLGNILSLILPKENIKLISNFYISNQIFSSFVVSISVLISSITIFYILKKNNHIDKQFDNKLKIIIFSAVYSFVFIPARFNFLINGQNVAIMGFPSDTNLYPHGLSLFLSFLGIIVPLSYNYSWIKINKKKIKVILQNISYILIFTATLIHPVIPISSIFILSISNLNKLLDNDRNVLNLKLIWISISKKYIIIWFLTVLLLSFIFNYNYNNLSNLELFNIYVFDRHPHHFLASFFLKSSAKKLFINWLILFFIYVFEKRNNQHNIFIRLIYLYLLSFIIITLLQLIGVEFLKIPFLIKIGPSRLYLVTKYLYSTIIISFILKYLITKINLLNIKISEVYENLFYYIFVNKALVYIIILFLFFNINTSHKVFEKSITKSPSFKLSKLINYSDIPKDYELMFSSETSSIFLYPREIGNINVFSDWYYTNEAKNIKNWFKRKQINKQFNNCIISKKDIDICINEQSNEFKQFKNLYFLSNQNNLSEFFLQARIDNNNYYFYRVN